MIAVLMIGGVGLSSAVVAAMLYMQESREVQKKVAGVQARTSAYSCANIAMLRLRKNRSYTGNENISVDKVVCSISAVVSVGSARTVHAQAAVDGMASRIKVEIQDIDYFFLNSWTEIPPT